jgi:PASTA domain-containing protein
VLSGFSADGRYMAALAARLPRIALIGGVLLFASATLTWGAAQRLGAVPSSNRTPVQKPTVVVPDVTGQAFVFAKGTLADAGFAWQVSGKVRGYATNTVATQTPAAGTKLIDTGAPLVQVGLTHGKYPETGEPEDVSPYLGTAVTLANPLPVAAPVMPAAPKAAKAKPAPVRKAAPAAKRTPAFAVAGAPKEPLDEITLTERARRLDGWLRARPQRSAANVNHFLYQQSWVITGAKFGWSRGAEALRLLIAADRRAQAAWGIGGKSELAARKALAEVEARPR